MKKRKTKNKNTSRPSKKMATRTHVVKEEDDDIKLVSFTTTPLTNKGTNKENPILVEKHSESRELIFALITSCTSDDYDDDELRVLYSTPKIQNSTTKSDDDDDDDDDVRVLCSTRKSQNPEKTPFGDSSITELGESSYTTQATSKPPILCQICVEPMPVIDTFPIKGCSHRYCNDCISKYVASKLQDNISNINCPFPECDGKVEPEQCQSILPPEVFDRWGNALCEALILGSERYYCPYKDCSALLLNDSLGESEVITQSECPYCRRLFCAQCRVGWHADMRCDEFQKLGEHEREREDIMLMKLAESKKWKRCTNCKFFVEKSEGCLYMKCRCGYAFCYKCGSPASNHIHYCEVCKS